MQKKGWKAIKKWIKIALASTLVGASGLIVSQPIIHSLNQQIKSPQENLNLSNSLTSEFDNNAISTYSTKIQNSQNKVVNLNEILIDNNQYNSVEFKELSITSVNDQNDVLFKLSVNQNNNLEINFLKEASSFTSSTPLIDKNTRSWLNTNIFRIEKITTNYNDQSHKFEQATFSDIVNTNKSNSMIVFNKSTGTFKLNNQTNQQEIILNENDFLLSQLYLTNKVNNIYNVSIKCQVGNDTFIFNNQSDDSQKRLVNYSLTNTSSNTNGIEGYLSKINNKWIWSFNHNYADNTSAFLGQLVNKNVIPQNYYELDANDALKKIPLNKKMINEQYPVSWEDVLNGLILKNFNASLLAHSKLAFIPVKAEGKINLLLSSPCVSYKQTDKAKTIYHFYNDNQASQPSAQGIVNGFKCGTQLLTNRINAQSLSVLPQKVLEDNNLKNKLYELIYSQGFGDENLLPSFNFKTDIDLKNLVFNNLDGKIQAELIIKNNYLCSTNGKPITNNVPKSFGQIEIINMATTLPTKLKQASINLNQNNELELQQSLLTPSEASQQKNWTNLKQVIFNHINIILDNLPNNEKANRDFLITDIVDLNSTNIESKKPGVLVLKNIKIKYYFNDQNGSYINEEGFNIALLSINGYKTVNPTMVNEQNYEYVNQNTPQANLYPQTFIEQNNIDLVTKIKTFILENTNKGFNIIQYAPKDFKITDINLSSSNIKYDNQNGLLKVSFSLLKWINEDQVEVTGTNFGWKTITLSGFQKAKVTTINDGVFKINNQANILASKFIDLPDAKKIVQEYIFDNAFKNLNIISGSLPDASFSVENIQIISLNNPDNANGQISVDFYLTSYINNQYQIKLNQTQNNALTKTIKLNGFKQIAPSKLIKTTFSVPNANNYFVDQYNDQQILSFLIEQQINNNLLVPVSDNFNVNNDLKLGTISRDNKSGIINIDIQFRNYYNEQAIESSIWKSFGSIKLINFKKASKTVIVNQTLKIDPSSPLALKKPTSINKTDLQSFLIQKQQQGELLAPVPINFNPASDLSILNITNQNDEEGTLMVQFKARSVYDQNVNIDPDYIVFPSVQINGFLSVKPTKIKNNLIQINNQYTSIYNTQVNSKIVYDLFNQYKNEIFTNLPPNFIISNNPIKSNLIIENIYNATNQNVNEASNNYLKYKQIISVQFRLNNFVDDNGEIVNNGTYSQLFQVNFKGFKPFPLLTINNRPIVVENQTMVNNLLLVGDKSSTEQTIKVNLRATGSNAYLNANVIYDTLNYLSDYQKINYILNGDVQNGIESLINFKTNYEPSTSTLNPITITKINSIKSIGNFQLTIDCNLAGNYYFLDSTPIAIDQSKNYVFTISGFNKQYSQKLEKNIVTIAVGAACGGVVFITLITIILFMLHDKIWNRRKDIYDDNDNDPISL